MRIKDFEENFNGFADPIEYSGSWSKQEFGHGLRILGYFKNGLWILD